MARGSWIYPKDSGKSLNDYIIKFRNSLDAYSLSIEIWRPVEDYPGYEVSNFGRLRRLPYLLEETANSYRVYQGAIYTPSTWCSNGKMYNLNIDGKLKYNIPVHVLEAKAFIPNPDNLPYVVHKDMCSVNNYVDNLEWSDTKDPVYGKEHYQIRCAESGVIYSGLIDIRIKERLDTDMVMHSIITGESYLGKHYLYYNKK